jgi:transposase InsO family protein
MRRWRLSAQTVRRVVAERPWPPTSSRTGSASASPAKLRRPNELWTIDITCVKGLFGLLSFRIASVLDAFSRLPLATRGFRTEPSSAQMAALVHAAARRHRPARQIVSDRGGQFTGEPFLSTLRDLGIRHRFGRLGEHHSVALLERFWRTLKHRMHLRWLPPLTPGDLERRLAYAVLRYSFYPHAALAGSTPAEAHYGWPPQHQRAVHPPRGRPGEPCHPPPFRLAVLDPQGHHPILVRSA